MPKALKEWQAFLDLKKTIDDFSECCPLLEMMAHKAMRPRHWERISTITSVTLDVESETFQLRQLMSAPLLPNKEDIEVRFNLLTYEFWNVGEKLPGCKWKWLLSHQQDKNITVCRKTFAYKVSRKNYTYGNFKKSFLELKNCDGCGRSLLFV